MHRLFSSLWFANSLLFTLYYGNNLCHFWIGVQVAAVILHPFLDVPQTHWGDVWFSESMIFFSKFCLFSGREICCCLWQLDKERLQSHFLLSIFYLGSIMNKQHFRWLTSKKCFLSSSCQVFGSEGTTSFQLWFSIILFLKSELWFFFLSKAYFFHNLSWEEKVAQFLFVFNLR